MTNSDDTTRAPGFLASDCRISGAIRGSGLMVIGGRVDGSIDLVGGVTIAEGGAVRGEVNANSADVAGTLEGDLSAEDAMVRASGRVVGDVRAKRMSLEDGGVISGALEMVVDLPDGLSDEAPSMGQRDA